MNYDKEVIEMCAEVFKSIGFKKMANTLEGYIALPDNNNLQKVCDEGMNWIDFSKLAKQRSFSFGNDYTINKYLIATAASRYNDNGDPIIAINELSDSDKAFKDNPIVNLYIVYDNEEERDKDYERVRFVMK